MYESVRETYESYEKRTKVYENDAIINICSTE